MPFSFIFRQLLLPVCSIGLLCAAGTPSQVQLPAWFEPSTTGGVFHSHGTAGALSIDSRGAWVQVKGADADALVRLRLIGASPSVLEGERPLPGKSFRFLGNDPRKWRKDIPQFERVRARGVYPGIDVVYYTAGRFLEYDFVLAPGADPNRIALRLDGGTAPVRADDGSLRLIAGGIELRHHRPFAYQDLPGGRRQRVDADYIVDADGQVRFAVGEYDPARPLVIDPVFTYSAYIGGTFIEVVNGVAAAPDGGFWVVGTASSKIEPPEGTDPYQSELKGTTDAFLAKVSPRNDGTWYVEHFSYLGGGDDDEGLAVTVDANGVVYLTGWTISIDFPLGGEAFATTKVTDGDRDVFVSRYDPRNGGLNNLTYSTYFGSTGRDQGLAIAVDGRGRIAVGGSTLSGTLPEAQGRGFYQPSNRGGTEGFLALFDPNASPASATLLMSTFFGGDGSETIDAIGFRSDGAIVAGGYTTSSDLPLAGSLYQPERNGPSDGFLAIFDASKTGFDQLLYGGYFGGSGIDRITALGIDAEDKVWITGYTQSQSFPTTGNAWSTTPFGSTDVFLARVDPTRSDSGFLLYSTLYGGSRTEVAYGLKVISPTRAVISGYTTSDDLPFFGIDGSPGKPPRALTAIFAAAFDTAQPASGSLAWSFQFGGAKTDVSVGVAVSPTGDVLVAGYTDSYGLNVPNEEAPGKVNGVGQPSGLFFCLRPDAR